MPPKATLAPRLWQRVSSTTSQTREPGTKAARSRMRRMRQTSSQFQAASLKSRKALEWSFGGAASGGLPDAADGAAPEADGPGGGHEAEEREDLLAEAGTEGL